MTELRFQHVDKAYGATLAARDVSFRIPSKSFGVVIGPSGCGKSLPIISRELPIRLTTSGRVESSEPNEK